MVFQRPTGVGASAPVAGTGSKKINANIKLPKTSLAPFIILIS
jgi:hypothetical protein